MATGRRLSVASLCGLLFVLLAWGYSEAQLPAANGQVKAVRGKSEVLRKGQANWVALPRGARLNEGDQVRTGPAASIEFDLPDGSNTVVAENTRYVITKLQYSPQNRQRNFGFHIVVGKISANVSRAAVQAVRARQANFFVSSPNGVAAVRGTRVVFLFNPATGQTLVAVQPSPGQSPATAVVTFISLATGISTTVTAGNFVTLLPGQPPSPQASIGTLASAVQQQIANPVVNTTTAGSDFLVIAVVEIPDIPATLIEVTTPTGEQIIIPPPPQQVSN